MNKKELEQKNKSLTEEIIRLDSDVKYFVKRRDYYRDLCGELEDENKRLNNLVEEQKKVLDGKDESIDRLGKRMYVLIRERDDAKQQCEELINRLRHLCESKIIAAFDEVDPRTKEYKLDISLMDKTMADYAAGKLKEAFKYVCEGSKLAEKSMKDLDAQLKAYTDKFPITCNYNIAINTMTEKEDKKNNCQSFTEIFDKLNKYGVVDEGECSVTPLPRPCLWHIENNDPTAKPMLCDFHRWVDRKPEGTIGGPRVWGLVECPDGCMRYAKPEYIQFCNEDGEVPDDIK